MTFSAAGGELERRRRPVVERERCSSRARSARRPCRRRPMPFSTATVALGRGGGDERGGDRGSSHDAEDDLAHCFPLSMHRDLRARAAIPRPYERNANRVLTDRQFILECQHLADATRRKHRPRRSPSLAYCSGDTTPKRRRLDLSNGASRCSTRPTTCSPSVATRRSRSRTSPSSAGVTRGLVHHYFGGRTEVYIGLLERLGAFREDQLRRPRGAAPAHG